MALVGQWLFDDSGAPGLDGSGTGNTAAFLGDANVSGGSAVFDGSGDYVHIPNNAAYDASEVTLAFSFTADTVGSEQGLVSRDSSNFDGGGHINITIQSNGSINVRHQSSNASYEVKTTSGFVTAGQNYDISYSFGADGGMQLFVDGALVDTNTQPLIDGADLSLSNNDEPWTVGAAQAQSSDVSAAGANRFFDGSIDFFEIYNEELTASEIPDARAGVVTDLSDNSDDGTVSGTDGDDAIYGGDTAVSGDGGTVTADSIDAGAGNDTIIAGDGADTLEGGAGDDLIQGGSGNDVITDSGTAVRAPVVIASEDFESGATGWSDNTTESDATFSQMLGRFAGTGGAQGVSKTFTLDDSMPAAVVEFDFYRLDSWDGEEFRIFVDDNQVFSQSFTESGNAQFFTDTFVDGGTTYTVTLTSSDEGTDLGFNASFDDQRYRVRIEVDDPNATLKLGFGSTLNQAVGDESFGIDNVLVLSAESTDALQSDIGSTGADSIDAGAGNDRVYSGDGDDFVEGGAGQDLIYGGGGADTLDGEDGADHIYAGDGNDNIRTSQGNDTLYGGAGDDQLRAGGVGTAQTLYGGGGNDDIVTFGQNDTIYAGTGNDFVNADGGSEYIDLGAGDDSAFAGFGDDTVFGGVGNDDIADDAGDDTIFAGAGNDTITDTFGNDSLFGGDGDDTIYGGLGSDSIDAGSGDGVIYGGDGDDQLRISIENSDNEVVYGGTGNDSLDIETSDDRNLSISLDAAGDGEVSDGAGGGQVFFGIEHLSGDGGDDVLSGNAQSNSIGGEAGDDSLDGGAGNDTLDGDTGADTLAGGAGNDLVYGGDDQDTILIDDGFGTDTIYGGEGGTDSDTLDLSALGTGITVTFTDDEQGTFTNGTDTGTFFGIESLLGSSFDDRVDAKDNDALGIRIDASGGNDSVDGSNSGADLVYGGSGNDEIRGWFGDDTLYGGIGDDIVTGDMGNDTVFGGDGDDILSSFAGDAVLYGGDGDDSFFLYNTNFGGAQGDFNGAVIYGGEGGVDDDTLDLSALGTGVTVTYTGDGQGTFSDGTDTGTFFGIEDIVLTDQNDDLDASNDTVGVSVDGRGGDDTLIGGAGNDTLTGGSGTDTLSGGAGNDTLTGNSNDIVFSGDGDDSVLGSGSGGMQIYGGSGTDSVDSGIGNDVIYGGDGDDNLDAAAQNDSIFGEAGNDSIIAGNGNDTVFGGTGDDSVSGGQGIDTLSGGSGNDTLSGGTEDDVFVLSANGGDDTVTDFAAGDQVDSSALSDAGNVLTNQDGTVTADEVTVTGGGGSDQILTFPNGETLTVPDGTVDQTSTATQFASLVAMGVPPCFAPGTLIETPDGPCAVEDLHIGDLVITADHGPQPLRWMGKRTERFNSRDDKQKPIEIKAGALGSGLPRRTLVVSPMHRMVLSGRDVENVFEQREVLALAKALTGWDHIRRMNGKTQIEYYALLFDRHEIIFAEGAATESFRPGHVAMAGFEPHIHEQIYKIYPKLRFDPVGGLGPPARQVIGRSEVEDFTQVYDPQGVPFPVDKTGSPSSNIFSIAWETDKTGPTQAV